MNHNNNAKQLDLGIREGPVWDTLKIVVEGASTDAVVEKALEAKTTIATQAYDLWRQALIIDDIIEYLAPDVPWTKGWNFDLATGSTKTVKLIKRPEDSASDTAVKGRRILEIADEMEEETETGAVFSKKIAEQLREEGYSGNIRDLSVSAGNVLTRSEVWARVRAGEYMRYSV